MTTKLRPNKVNSAKAQAYDRQNLPGISNVTWVKPLQILGSKLPQNVTKI